MNISSPIDSFITCIKTLDLRSQAYALRPVFGALNSSAIGSINQVLRTDRPKAASGIDGFNDKLNEIISKRDDVNGLSDMGLTPFADPKVTVGYIAGIRETLREEINLPDELMDLIDNMRDSLQFMSQPRTLNARQLEAFAQLAKDLEIDKDVLIETTKTANQRDADQLRAHGTEIIDTYLSITPIDDFDNAPARLKAKVVNILEQTLVRQIGVIQQSIIRTSSPARLGDITFIQQARKEIKAWSQQQASQDTDFALAMVA